MKRTMRIFAALLLLAMLSAACSHYVCPAYTNETAKEQNDSERS
jgi:hypothetical protein